MIGTVACLDFQATSLHSYALLPCYVLAVTSKLDYFNTLTNFSQGARPPPVRGGILADDMGLGGLMNSNQMRSSSNPVLKGGRFLCVCTALWLRCSVLGCSDVC
jgi:hypothetical protein